MTYVTSDAGIDSLKKRECPPPNFDYVLTAYDDAQPGKVLQKGDAVIGTLTIDCGHTGPDVYIGRTDTREQAVQVLRKDIAWAEACINKNVSPSVTLTQNQFDALVSFVFQLGVTLFEKSSVLKLINAGKLDKVPAAMRLYKYANGDYSKPNPGVVSRRDSEVAQWQKGSYVASSTIDISEPPVWYSPNHPNFKYIATAATSVTGGALTDVAAQVQGLGSYWHGFVVLGLVIAFLAVVVKAIKGS